jgi:photosystem II stability/assembly factor-like uncharacterized protein
MERKMRTLKISLLVFILAISISAQWEWQHPLPPGNGLVSVKFVNETTGYAVGDESIVLKTTDSGNSWIRKDIGYYGYLKDIEFANENIGWILDFQYGRIFKTTDSGDSWYVIADLEDGYYWDMFFLNSNVGWIAGYENIYKTTDGGFNWAQQYWNQGYDINTLFFLNEQNGWALARDLFTNPTIILRTTDGGYWEEYPQSNIPDLQSIYFTSSSIGFAAGTDGLLSGNEGYIWKSTNGGITWSNNFTGNYFYDVNFIDAQTGYTIGIDILKTTNAGISWNNVLPNGGVSSISLIGQNYGWAVGGAGSILKTTNAGQDWIVLAQGDHYHLTSIDFANRNNGIAVSLGGKIIHTTNAGQNWELSAYIPSSGHFYSVSFPDSQNAWASGHYGVIYHSSDGGNNWTLQNSGVSIPLRSIYFINAYTGWVAGNTGTMLKTTNGGQNWFQLNTGTTGWLHTIFFLDENNGWAAGSYSTLIKTTDGGLSWQPLIVPGVQLFNSVFFLDESIGWLADGASGGAASIYKTTDGGSSWIEQLEIQSVSYNFNDIYFKNENFGWAAGSEGDIWFSTNGGDVWILTEDDIYNNLESIAHCETDELWIAGSYELILYSMDGGVPVELISFTTIANNNEVTLNWSTATETNNSGFEIQKTSPFPSPYQGEGGEAGRGWEIIGFVPGHGTTTETQHYSFTDNDVSPGKYQYKLKQIDYDGTFEYSKVVEVEIPFVNKFSLSQNYPNPFNPSTSMQYTIGSRQFVSLKVYDLLGREVATLVNEEKPAGEYEVEFDGSNFPSGIYFYQLKAGDFVQTKKMILMK